MTREQAKREIDSLDFYLQNHTDDYGEESHTAMMMAIKALEQQTCEDAVSRKDVLNLVDNLNDGSFRWASIRTKIARLHLVQPELEPCEDAVSREAVLDIFADNADAIRPYHKTWSEVKALPSVNPQPKTGHWEKMVEVYDLQQNRMLVPYGYDDAKFGNTPVYVCACGCESNKNSRFCPDCGCRMVDK